LGSPPAAATPADKEKDTLKLPTAASPGVTSLRIKAKEAPSKSGKKKSAGSSVKGENMFGDAASAQWEEGGGGSANGLMDDIGDSHIPRVNALTHEYELVSQTLFNGELYKAGRVVHLFLADVQPNKSYFILPSTSTPGQEHLFELQLFANTTAADLRLEPCHLNAAGDAAAEMNALASRRAAAMGASSPAGLASHKGKRIAADTAKAKPKHKKEQHR
jgi:hypothetical protein